MDLDVKLKATLLGSVFLIVSYNGILKYIKIKYLHFNC